MTDTGNVRKERIIRLLTELRYEIDCEFRTRPIPLHTMDQTDMQPRLRPVMSRSPPQGAERIGSR